MAEFIQCRWCEHCDTNRKKEDKVRCKIYSQWVDPCDYGIKGCKNYDYYKKEKILEDYGEAIKKFMEAQQEAEKFQREHFTCPLCGGSAWWGRSKHNNHLHTGCKKCGFKMME